MINRTHFRALAAALATALVALHAPAQIVDLPPTLHTKTVISPADRTQIDSFAQAHADALQSDTVAQDAITRSRNDLTRPVQNANVTLAFRQAYAQAVTPIARTLAGSDDPVRRLAGIRIAGVLGTDDAASIVLDAVESDDPGTVYFAVIGLGDALATLASGSPSLSTQTAQDIIAALQNVIVNADDPVFADAAIRALIGAAYISQPNQLGTRHAALTALANATGDRLRATRAADPDADQLMISALRACGAVRTAISNPQITPTRATAVAAIRLGADAFGFVFSRVRSGVVDLGADEEDRSLEIALVQIAEQTLYRGRIAAGEASPPPTETFAQLESGDSRQFNFRTSELIGPESAIVGAYGFDRDRFIRPAADD
ncbi:MAG: hypothetical protein ACF8Q5_12025 [Phycisphaerales bacterium JB040]